MASTISEAQSSFKHLQMNKLLTLTLIAFFASCANMEPYDGVPDTEAAPDLGTIKKDSVLYDHNGYDSAIVSYGRLRQDTTNELVTDEIE